VQLLCLHRVYLANRGQDRGDPGKRIWADPLIGDREPLIQEDRYGISHTHGLFKSDLFALGRLLYEISTGSRPYDEIEDTEVE
jgi:hypothetical protein